MTKLFGSEIYLRKKVMRGLKKQGERRKEPEIELFIEPLTGLAIPMPNQEKKGGK
jgi:hypothetical protein